MNPRETEGDDERTASRVATVQSRLETALEAGQIGTWVWSFAEQRIYTDRNFFIAFGLPPDTPAEGPFDHYVGMVHPEDRDAVIAVLRNCIQTGVPYEMSYRIAAGDGTRWIRARGRLSRDEQGRPLELSGVVIDVTERKLAEIREAETNRRQTEFLATLAHELRNPLATMRNGLEIMRRMSLDNPLVELRDMMDRQMTHINRLVDDLTDLSRVASGKIELDLSPVDLCHVAQRGAEMVRAAVEGSRQRLCLATSAPVTVQGDPVRLSQVCANLLGNASKFSPEGGNLWVKVYAKGNKGLLEVSDDGRGIAAEAIPFIFDMFHQGSEPPNHGQRGLGIGLSLVKNLVERHGGSIQVKSDGPGLGSRFTCEFPLKDH